jgi:hypothetical protein
MSEQARKIEHEAVPQRAEGLYYNKGLSSEALVYYDDEASKGQGDYVVFS